MTKRNTILFFLLLPVICISYMACTKDDSGRNPCLEPRRYFLNLRSFQAADTGSEGVELKMPSPVVGYVDTPIWFGGSTIPGSSFSGPLSGIADSTRWFIIPDTMNWAGRDTITFYYQRKPVFLSTSCGYAIVYSLQRLVTTNYLIDSARIEKSEVNGASDVIHVKVFY